MENRNSALPSISNPLMNIAVVFGVAVGCFMVFFQRPGDSLPIASLELIVCLALPCVIVEIFFNRSPQNAGIAFSRRDFCPKRTLRKVIALWCILAVMAFCYHAFPIYRTEFYAPFQWLLEKSFAPILVLSVPYLALVDMMQDDPEDSLWHLGNRFFSPPHEFSKAETTYLLGWLVKGFFFPLMFCYLCGQVSDLRGLDISALYSSSYMDVVRKLYDLLFLGFFFIDLIIAATGYVMTYRLLGTHIRSVEPTLLGWLVTVLCYQPFYYAVYSNFLSYTHGRPWGAWLSDQPVLYTLWAMMILVCLSFYVWATVCFGIRFSNLTNRGIITTGPYRWTKHPAYIAKNISWWLISIPFLPPDSSVWTAVTLCTGLLIINSIYFMRAKTEERHLLKDPVYQAYVQHMQAHGVFRRLNFSAT